MSQHGQPAGNDFGWSAPSRSDGLAVYPTIPHGAGVTTRGQVLQVNGRWNNCDVYLSASTQWLSPLVALNFALVLEAMVNGTPFEIETVTLATLPTIQLVNGNKEFRAYVLSARGRPCDGFRVSYINHGPLIDVPFDKLEGGQATAYAWGSETAPATVVDFDPGATLNVHVTGPNPLPVSGTVTANEGLSATPVDLVGTAPSGGLATPIVGIATPTRNGVIVSADESNAAGSILYVSHAAVAIASAAYQLGPGDSTPILPVADAASVFVNGSAAGLKWRAAVYKP